MNQSYVSLLLNSHIPYVREKQDHPLEERWIYEAMIESYVPLLKSFEHLTQEQIKFRITLSLSPTVLSMLTDPLIQKRCEEHLNLCIELAQSEIKRTHDHQDEYRLAAEYLMRYEQTLIFLQKYHYNLIPAFQSFFSSGHLELITSSATHGFLPFMETKESQRAQIGIAVDTFENIFDIRPQGIWLPECGFKPEIDEILAEFGINYFIVDSHAFEHCTPHAVKNPYAPIQTPHKVHAFARDSETSKKIWSPESGYPSHPDYRDFYRDIGHDLNKEYIGPYIHPYGIRVCTGFKYYKITDKGNQKQHYQPDEAFQQVTCHADDFVDHLRKRTETLHAQHDTPPIFVLPFDTELFGHWWYEGPLFLKEICKKLSESDSMMQMVTFSEYLEQEQKQNEHVQLGFSTWGVGGYGEVWLNKANIWIYQHLHQAEIRLRHLVNDLDHQSPNHKRALKQAARELLLAQSSDWAYIMDDQTQVEYAIKRTHDHLVRFQELCQMIESNQLHDSKIKQFEQDYPIFPHLNLDYYQTSETCSSPVIQTTNHKPTILMLSWEYPPHFVGGLSQAVYHLTRHLVTCGCEVHVVTYRPANSSAYECVEGVHVHRVSTYLDKDNTLFFDWVFSLNIALLDKSNQLIADGFSFDILHLHDWLVAFAGEELKFKYQFPTVTTMHVLECIKNRATDNEINKVVHQVDEKVIHLADHVIVCSDYMKKKIKKLFSISSHRLSVIKNGVVPPPSLSEEKQVQLQQHRENYAQADEQIILFVGRMVQEKGVYLVLEAASSILRTHPQAKFLFAGTGADLEKLRQQARNLNIEKKAVFLGFITEEEKDMLYRMADLCIFPSLTEAFGIVALEAMAYQKPTLASKTGGFIETIQHRKTGFIMKNGSVESLIENINFILDHPETSKKIGMQAYTHVTKNYGWDHIAEQTSKLYHKLTK
ncbi:DUF1957 domain-containing protein [Hazenella sp. IB182357]|uniref:DUF1957 domain-containing protein n=1 Tax=Polycladospora coralii TaxID=2771432 RepID=A0A926NDS3_9BACL|nr:1,4-alpha-glucan branching protein domain-containing protein [Polycladospora coralii]MBD1371709.1 DUF1957 domain-containing protein [Polycladospora coralii]MBS7529176.1 DUF1957 domain-containing protein [Polycladospora coralii]